MDSEQTFTSLYPYTYVTNEMKGFLDFYFAILNKKLGKY